MHPKANPQTQPHRGKEVSVKSITIKPTDPCYDTIVALLLLPKEEREKVEDQVFMGWVDENIDQITQESEGP